jgi:hypothetical protein
VGVSDGTYLLCHVRHKTGMSYLVLNNTALTMEDWSKEQEYIRNAIGENYTDAMNTPESSGSSTTVAMEGEENVLAGIWYKRTTEANAFTLVYDATHKVLFWVDSAGNGHWKATGKITLESDLDANGKAITNPGSVAINAAHGHAPLDIRQNGQTFVNGLILRESASEDAFAIVLGGDEALWFGYAANATGGDASADFSNRLRLDPSTGIRVYESAGTKYVEVKDDGTDGIIATSSGDLSLNPAGDVRLEKNLDANGHSLGAFVARGDVGWDWDHTTLTDDTNFNDLDLSAIIPASAKAVQFFVNATDGAAGSWIGIRKNGYATDTQTVYTQVANQAITFLFIIPPDSNRKVEVKCSPKPTDWTSIYLKVQGWWI